MSLPARGAWIEIYYLILAWVKFILSLPARGAWIEIISTTLTPSAIWRRSPHGERGLKFVAVTYHQIPAHVAPRTGSVD